MGLKKKLREWLSTDSIPERQYGVTDEVFFLALLNSVPDGSTIGMADDEPDRWQKALKPWAIAKTKRREPQAYRIDDGFRHAVADLLKDSGDFWEIHLLGIESPEGQNLFWMSDNFTDQGMSETIRSAVDNEIKSQATVRTAAQQQVGLKRL